MASTPIHPGEILGDGLEELGLSAKKLADIIQVPPNRLHQLLAGKRNVTAVFHAHNRAAVSIEIKSRPQTALESCSPKTSVP
jgi:plasmid maintenance system antidote protein VapI